MTRDAWSDDPDRTTRRGDTDADPWVPVDRMLRAGELGITAKPGSAPSSVTCLRCGWSTTIGNPVTPGRLARTVAGHRCPPKTPTRSARMLTYVALALIACLAGYLGIVLIELVAG